MSSRRLQVWKSLQQLFETSIKAIEEQIDKLYQRIGSMITQENVKGKKYKLTTLAMKDDIQIDIKDEDLDKLFSSNDATLQS